MVGSRSASGTGPGRWGNICPANAIQVIVEDLEYSEKAIQMVSYKSSVEDSSTEVGARSKQISIFLMFERQS